MHTKCTLRHRTEDGSVGSIDAVELDVNFAQTMQLRGRAKEDPSFHNDERNANARRLVACWNACQDVPTQVLESIGKGYGPTWLQAKDERDELLAALKGLVDDIRGLMDESDGVAGLHLNGDLAPWSELDSGGMFERLTHLTNADDAIAKAEG